jgi:ribulose-phosphate 3-epimerase
MMGARATICPTLLAEEPHGFRVQLQRVSPFAQRLHIDVMDGIFASPRSLGLDQLHWPANLPVDLHVMYQRPVAHANMFIALGPQMIIVHAEAEGAFLALAAKLRRHGIETGVALLPETPVKAIAPAIDAIDHALIFSGHLGHFGGQADLRLLSKARELRALKPSLEIGWDGGINANNARQLIAGGVDVLNVGGFIQHATNPATAYATLSALA